MEIALEYGVDQMITLNNIYQTAFCYLYTFMERAYFDIEQLIN